MKRDRSLIDRGKVRNDFNDRSTVHSTAQFTTTRECEDTSRVLSSRAITVRRQLLNKIRMGLHLCRKGHERTNRTRLTGSSRGPGWLQQLLFASFYFSRRPPSYHRSFLLTANAVRAPYFLTNLLYHLTVHVLHPSWGHGVVTNTAKE